MSPPPRQILRTSKECNYLLRRMLSSRAQPGSPASAGFALAGVEERGIRFCVVMEKADSSRQKLALPMTTTQTNDLAGRSCRVVIPVSTCPSRSVARDDKMKELKRGPEGPHYPNFVFQQLVKPRPFNPPSPTAKDASSSTDRCDPALAEDARSNWRY